MFTYMFTKMTSNFTMLIVIHDIFTVNEMNGL